MAVQDVPEWLWVVVETRGEEETLFALEEEQKGLKFIPAFKNQEEGEACRKKFNVPSGAKHELQAIRLSVLAQAAKKEQAEVTILDMIDAGGVEVSVSESDGLRLRVWSESLFVKLELALHAWMTEGSFGY